MQRVKKLNNKLNHYFRNSNYIKHSRHLRLVFFSASAALIAIMTLAVFPIIRETSTAEAASSGTASSITMTTTSASARLNLNVTDPSGVFVKSSSNETINFGVKTNNYTGYTLSISSDDDLGYLTNTDTSITTNNKLSSITTTTDELTFSDASNASSYNGKWGYKPSKINSVDNVAFLPSPTTTATTLDTTESANPDTNNDYTIGLGARADYTLSAGTYAHTFNLAATANPVVYTVTYQDNTGDTTVYNLPDSIVDNSTTRTTTTATEITLSSVTPSRTGYVFAGWCDIAPTNSGQTCSGTTYAAGSSYGINQTTSNNIVLYATWSIPTYNITIKPSTGIASVSLNGTTCTNTAGCVISNLPYNTSYTLTATMANGYSFAAWSNEGAGVVTNITSTSTNFTVGEGDAVVSAIASGEAAQAVTVNFAYAGGGTAGVSSVVFKESATGTTAGTVSASGGKVSLKPGVGYTMTTNSATNYGIKSYATSAGTLADTASSSGTNYFTPSSSVATITVNTCLKTIPTTTMQAYNTNINYLCDDATGTLTDSRDSGKTYTVGVVTSNNSVTATRKLWMTQNLSIGCTTAGAISQKTLTSANSNVTADYTTPATSGQSDSYTDSKIVCSDDANKGAWYNYVAATAGTITGDSNNTNATKDICPAGWRLPNLIDISAAASNISAFRPVAGGSYYGGSLHSTGYGYWWSNNESGSATSRWYLARYSSSFSSTAYNSRYSGYYVRCVKS